MYCTNCGKKIDDDANFCPYCNNKVSFGESHPISKEMKSTIPKALSESENQPTGAIVSLGIAILVFAYGVVCFQDELVTNQTLGFFLIGISIIIECVGYHKLKVHKEKYGLNGIGYKAYLIGKIIFPILIVLLAFFALGFVLTILEMLRIGS